MLTELFIRNFAIIDELRLQFASGFNVLTGETGAGKSIILDAMLLVLGNRADTTMVRAEAESAYVEATFRLSKSMQDVLLPILQEEGLDEEDNDLLLLTRELRLSGRNICRINGRTVSLNLLRQLAEPLIDIHGQGEHLSLLKPKSHLPLLDAYAGLTTAQAAVGREVGLLQAKQRELNDLRQNERMIQQHADMLQFQIEEIDAAKLKPEEEDELREERTRLANAEQLTQSATEAIANLTGLDSDSEQSVIDLLGQVERSLTQLVKFDESKHGLLENLQGLSFQLNETAVELQDYLEEIEFNPGRLDFVEERLELINRLKRKYGGSISEMLALRDNAQKELDKLSHSEENKATLEKDVEQLLHRIGKLAKVLSDQRKLAAKRLATAVEQELGDLRMAGTRFSVDFQVEEQRNGVYVGDQQLAFDRMGIDKVEFLLSPNPGEPLKPMAKVASGGETARLMLALKTALTAVDNTPTLIFDEIDQGIGGRVGDTVGQKLWGLTKGAQDGAPAEVSAHQVIVVTHLPQLAGYGDAHFHVSKHVNDGRTSTKVINLDRDGRIRELAAMLGTQDEHARQGADSILQLAAQNKAKK